MPRLSKEEEALKIQALWTSYEEFLDEGIDTPSYDQVTNRANQQQEVRACSQLIGAKTLAQSKNKQLIKLREAIKSKKTKVAELKTLAPTELSIKIEQLHSSLQANAILAEKIENLEKRLENKTRMLEQKETHILEFSTEISKLRKEIEQLKADNASKYNKG